MNEQHAFDLPNKPDFQVTCPFCSVGCRFKILKGFNEVIFSNRTQDVIDFDYANAINEGSLCPRGHFSYELLSHPMRLGRAYHRNNGELEPEIPEQIFQNIVDDLKKNPSNAPLAILINPMISLHDIRALLDFANNNQIEAIDFVSPVDRHLLRALIDNPFEYPKCDDPRILKNLNYSLCIGDVFTKQPVLSRHLLKAKYAFRQNALFCINPVSTRTSWFANISLENVPHSEPLYLAYLFQKIYSSKKDESGSRDLKILNQQISDYLGKLITAVVPSDKQKYLDFIAEFLLSPKKSSIFFSTHHYNNLGSYLSTLLCTGISSFTQCYFIPLYSDGNFNAIEQFSKEVYPNLSLGKKPLLHSLINQPFNYLFAVGWNPQTYYPGNVEFPDKSKWIISSMVQDTYPKNTFALLPDAHLYEKMDLRTNFVSWQSIGSSPVKAPIGSAQSLAHFIYLFYQKAAEKQISLKSSGLPKHTTSWDKNTEKEMAHYVKIFEELGREDGTWLIPYEHMAHYKDAQLTQYSSWAQRECIDEQLTIPTEIARQWGIKNNQAVFIKGKRNKEEFKANIGIHLPPDRLVAYAHYLPVRKMMNGEFASHNQEYYFWCPKIQF
jgi:Molybdopterin oxidoreductase Fe4S4 domain